MAAVRAYVGVTDWDWYRFLQGRGATEVNFWQPSGGRRFVAIPEGAPFFFKSHYSHGNRIVGGGFLSGWASLPMTRAWEFFGEDNGCATLVEMRTRILRYWRRTLDDGEAVPRDRLHHAKRRPILRSGRGAGGPTGMVGKHRAGA
jgi:putative restriction endonuclease